MERKGIRESPFNLEKMVLRGGFENSVRRFLFSPKFWKFRSEINGTDQLCFGPTGIFGTTFKGGPL